MLYSFKAGSFSYGEYGLVSIRRGFAAMDLVHSPIMSQPVCGTLRTPDTPQRP